jgi:hypothetical protein
MSVIGFWPLTSGKLSNVQRQPTLDTKWRMVKPHLWLKTGLCNRCYIFMIWSNANTRLHSVFPGLLRTSRNLNVKLKIWLARGREVIYAIITMTFITHLIIPIQHRHKFGICRLLCCDKSLFCIVVVLHCIALHCIFRCIWHQVAF